MKRAVKTILPTPEGKWDLYAYIEKKEDERMPHLALVHPLIDVSKPVLSRVHSECFTGDVLFSKRCDCNSQLHYALRKIYSEKGALIYLRQEGRGIGLVNKLHAYNLQDQGYDTVEANHQLGFKEDDRSYEIAVNIYKDLNINRIRLMTNNPKKVEAFSGGEVTVTERIPLVIPKTERNASYLETKRKKMGHWL